MMKRLAIVLFLLLPLAQNALAAETGLARVHELFRLHDSEGAARELPDLVMREPRSVELRAHYIVTMQRRDGVRARELARRLSIAHPGDAWAWYAVGWTNLLEQEAAPLKEAFAAIERMVELAPSPLPAPMLRLKVWSYLRHEKLDEALAFLGDRDDAAALHLEGLVVESMSSTDPTARDRAAELYRRASAADPDDLRIVASHVHLLDSIQSPGTIAEARQLVARSPLSLSAHEMLWMAIANSRELTAAEKEAAIAEDAAPLLAARDWPEIYAALYHAYRRAESAKTEEIDRELIARFPWSPEAEYAMQRRMLADRTPLTGDAEQIAARRRAIEEFIDFPSHPHPRALGGAYLRLMMLNVRDPKVSDAEYLRAIDGVRALLDDPLNTKAVVAEALAERGLRLELAEQLARESVRELPRMIEHDRASYPGAEYDDTVKRLEARGRSALGIVLLKRGKLEEAGRELKASSKLEPLYPMTNLHLGRWHEKKGDTASAELAYARGMAHEPPTHAQNLEALKALYVRKHGKEEGFTEYAANLRLAGASDEKRKVLASRITPPKPVEPFTLEDLAGKSVSLASTAGAVTVINFWGLWCAPCVSEMPALQKLQEKYAGDPQVKILTINNDRDLQKVASYIEKNGFSFPVLVDDGWIAKKGRIVGWPTTWFLDANGRLAFVKNGAINNLVEEFSWRIDALKAVNAGGNR